MHWSALLSLAVLSASLAPCSATGGTAVVLAQPAFHNSPIHANSDATRRKRSASHLSVMMARQEEKRQLGNAASSAADALSSTVGSVTRAKATEASSTAASFTTTTRSSPSVVVPSSTPRVSQTPVAPVLSSTSSTPSPAITSPVTSAHTVSEIQGITDVESSTFSSSTISSSVSSSTPASTQSTSTVTSVMNSASTDAQGSVSYVTSVETVRATASSTTTSLANDVTSLETVFATASATGNSSAGAAAASSTAGSNDSEGLSTGVIIAISVVGGVAVLAIGLFIIWKLKQKRFSGYDDDVDGIKWPELNRHGESSTMNLPLPAKPTGGHGFETNALERRMDLDDDGMDDYDTYSAPVSYANSANDHYGGYHESSPPLPSMGYMDNAHGAYGMSTIAAGEGVTLGRTKSSGGYSFSDEHHTPLGGTSAFEVGAPDMMEMTGAQYTRVDDAHNNANVGRSRSGRLL